VAATKAPAPTIRLRSTSLEFLRLHSYRALPPSRGIGEGGTLGPLFPESRSQPQLNSLPSFEVFWSGLSSVGSGDSVRAQRRLWAASESDLLLPTAHTRLRLPPSARAARLPRETGGCNRKANEGRNSRPKRLSSNTSRESHASARLPRQSGGFGLRAGGASGVCAVGNSKSLSDAAP